MSPVMEMKDDSITVRKGKEKWKIAKDSSTKVTGDLKVGSKVTIEYTMKAATVEVKDTGKKAEPKKAESPAIFAAQAPYYCKSNRLF
jgi:ribosomal 50S subunit-recycling heat shock protein